jgi:hypothetical protein
MNECGWTCLQCWIYLLLGIVIAGAILLLLFGSVL